MPSPLNKLSAISLFVDDLPAAKDFYLRVFGVPVLFEDEASVAVKFDNLIVNLLRTQNAAEIVAPGVVAAPATGHRFQISIWVPDVDAVCEQLKAQGVTDLTGPVLRPWGMRTVNFVDPAGHSWEVGQHVQPS